MVSKQLLGDTNGAVMVEVTIMLSIILVLVLGGIELLFLFYQWNAAAKAVQIGCESAWQLGTIKRYDAAGVATLHGNVSRARAC